MPGAVERVAETSHSLMADTLSADQLVHIEPATPQVDTRFAQGYLNEATTGHYLDSIGNGSGTAGAIRAFGRKVMPLYTHAPNAKLVASVGVGAGDELAGLSEVFGDSIQLFGVDISRRALTATAERLAERNIQAHLIEGSATHLPFAPGSIDALVVSALLHEVYSYMPDGKRALRDTIAETALVGSIGSRTLLRDFAAPSYRGTATVTLKSPEARDFYNYFSTYFRTFEGADYEDARENFTDTRQPHDDDFPKLGALPVAELDMNNLAELLLHFVYYSADTRKGIDVINDPLWKENNERYLPPNPEKPGITPMTIREYGEFITSVGGQVLAGTPAELTIVERRIDQRQKIAAFLARHFDVAYNEERILSSMAIRDCTSKMRLIIGKDLRADAGMPYSS